VRADVGGIAGGSKFLIRNIFLKFPKDSAGLYGGDEWSQKSAGHELKGLSAIIGCRIDHLHVPLMCVVNYLGFQLVAQTILPISRRTLIFGSSDGGRTIHGSDGQFIEMLQRLAMQLNLKPHAVGAQTTVVYTPADMEGHLGQDGRYYVIDSARLCPPHPPLIGYERLARERERERDWR
jgi:hypothetical protein